MNVVLKNGETKKYKLTLEMVGYGKRWHSVEYSDILQKLEEVYPELKGKIKRAYL